MSNPQDYEEQEDDKGDNWQNESIDKLRRGEDDKIVIPYYGRPARITLPRK